MAIDLAVSGVNSFECGLAGTTQPVLPRRFVTRSFNGLHREDKLWPKSKSRVEAKPLTPGSAMGENWSRRHAKKMGQYSHLSAHDATVPQLEYTAEVYCTICSRTLG